MQYRAANSKGDLEHAVDVCEVVSLLLNNKQQQGHVFVCKELLDEVRRDQNLLSMISQT
jgi:hypothetical protein